MQHFTRTRVAVFVLAFSLFIALPLFIAGYLLNSFFRQKQETLNQKIIQHSQKDLEKVAGLTDVNFLIEKQFGRLRDQYLRQEITPDRWPQVRDHIKRKWGFDFDVYLYSGTGELITPKSMKIRSRHSFANFRNYLFHHNPTFIKDQAKTLKTFFGGLLTNFPEIRGRVVEFRGVSGSGLLFWDADLFSTEGGIVLVAWAIPSATDVIQARLNTSTAPKTLTIFSVNNQGKTIPLLGNVSASESLSISQQIASSGASLVRVADRNWVSLKAGDGTFFLGKNWGNRGMDRWKQWTLALLPLVGLIGFLVSYRWIIQERNPYISIRFKLVILFLYALSISFMGVMALAYKTLRDTERVLLEELKTTGETAIQGIDDGFIHEPEKFRKSFDLFHERLNNPQVQTNISRAMNRYPWARYFHSLELRDGGGRVLQTLGRRISPSENINAILDSATCEAIRKFLPDRFIPNVLPKLSGNAEIFVKSLAESSETGAVRLFEFPGKLTRFVSPGLDIYLYGNVFPNRVLPGAYVSIAMNSSMMRNQYVKKTLLTVRNDGSHNMRLFAVDESCSHWLPERGSRSTELTRFALRLRRANEPISDTLNDQNRRWIATGMPGKQVSGYYFIALLPTEPVYRSLQDLKNKISAGMCFALFITILLGWALSDIFLTPITNLGKGIAALKGKNVRFRLDSFSRDELGDLSHAFNDMMDNLEEFTSGKIVQEQLFPKAGLSLKSYSVFGLSRPATDLGGDYFDYLKIDDSQFLVLLGDVSGHGIPAALIMAMAKAVISGFSTDGNRPEVLLERLNRAIFSVMRGKKIMTLGLFQVQVDTHQIAYYHFGQTFPMIVRQNGSTEFVRAVGMPIGCRESICPKGQIFSLEPGDRVLLYSDGLIESLGTSADTDSFESFREYVSGQTQGPLHETCRRILDQHPFFSSGEPQPDDFTLVMMERAP